MKIFVPLICYNHSCNAEYMMSMLSLLNAVKNRGINCTFYPIFFESLISRARNASVAHFLEDEESTRLVQGEGIGTAPIRDLQGNQSGIDQIQKSQVMIVYQYLYLHMDQSNERLQGVLHKIFF